MSPASPLQEWTSTCSHIFLTTASIDISRFDNAGDRFGIFFNLVNRLSWRRWRYSVSWRSRRPTVWAKWACVEGECATVSGSAGVEVWELVWQHRAGLGLLQADKGGGGALILGAELLYPFLLKEKVFR